MCLLFGIAFFCLYYQCVEYSWMLILDKNVLDCKLKSVQFSVCLNQVDATFVPSILADLQSLAKVLD